MGLFDKITGVLNGEDSAESESDNSKDGAFDIPEWVVEDRVNVDKRTEIIYEHYDVTHTQAHTIAKRLKKDMESTEGFSVDSIRYDLEDELDIDEELIHTIIWTETASINTLDRVNKYLEQGRQDDVYKLQCPDDDRTHPISREAAEEIEERGGVSMKEIARILIEKAEKYEDEGGTPERMEHWVPHERFRFSIMKHIDY